MIKRFLPTLFLCPLYALSAPAEPDSVKLVAACNELVQMYDRNGKETKLVSWFGSVSEGMQAGYCRGVVVEFQRNDAQRIASGLSYAKPCKLNAWFQAQVLANISKEDARETSVDRLLEQTCAR